MQSFNREGQVYSTISAAEKRHQSQKGTLNSQNFTSIKFDGIIERQKRLLKDANKLKVCSTVR